MIDEFDSTGTFLRSFPSPLAHPGYFTEGYGGAAIDPTNGNVLISEGSYSAETEAGGVREFDASANFLGTDNVSGEFFAIGQPVVNSAGYAYIPSSDTVTILNPAPIEPKVELSPGLQPDPPTGGTLEATVDPNGGGQVTECEFEYVAESEYQEGAARPLCLRADQSVRTADSIRSDDECQRADLGPDDRRRLQVPSRRPQRERCEVRRR